MKFRKMFQMLVKFSLMPTWTWCHWCCHFDEDIEDPTDDAEDPRDGLEAPVDVGEVHEVLESLMKTMMPWQRSWNPLLGWHDGTLMKPLYVLWWWWPYMVSGMWWMPLPWKRNLEGSWTWYMKISKRMSSRLRYFFIGCRPNKQKYEIGPETYYVGSF